MNINDLVYSQEHKKIVRVVAQAWNRYGEPEYTQIEIPRRVLWFRWFVQEWVRTYELYDLVKVDRGEGVIR